MLICVVCGNQWSPKHLNFHDLCNSCFGVYGRLKHVGRAAERMGRECSDNERFFAYTMFPFSDSSGVDRLNSELLGASRLIGTAPKS
jgi:hypothetical protein